MAFTLGQRMARNAALFQFLVAFPTMFFLGEYIWIQLFDDYYYTFRLYDFIMSTFNALMAGGIIFIIVTQRYAAEVLTKKINLYFEIVKSALATAVWLWFMADAIWGPQDRYRYNPPPDHSRGPKITRSAVSVVCLLFLFYPTLAFAIWDVKHGSSAVDEEGTVDGLEGAGERTPLLRE